MLSGPLVEQSSALAQHQGCFVCGENPFGLAVNYRLINHHCIEADFLVEARHQGYRGLLHGGLASTLLDGAMTHYLLAKNIPALTAELSIRYHYPIELGSEVKIRAMLDNTKRGIYHLSAEIIYLDQCVVSAKGKFIVPKPTA